MSLCGREAPPVSSSDNMTALGIDLPAQRHHARNCDKRHVRQEAWGSLTKTAVKDNHDVFTSRRDTPIRRVWSRNAGAG